MADKAYNYAHQKERERAIATMVDGTPCPFCHLPMHKTQRLDYDHVVPIAMGGMDGPKRLSHSHCNQSSGASMGNRMRRANYTNRPKGLLYARKRNGTVAPSRRLPKWLWPCITGRLRPVSVPLGSPLAVLSDGLSVFEFLARSWP